MTQLLLARLLLQFPETVKSACDNLDPSYLAKHSYEIAKAFNQFYNSTPVLAADNAELKKARLQLVKAVAIIIKKGFSFLGIETVDRM